MTNEDSKVWLRFNGEIFNFQELRESLLQVGHRSRTAVDAETIIRAYEQYGEDFLNHLQGPFALGLFFYRIVEIAASLSSQNKAPGLESNCC